MAFQRSTGTGLTQAAELRQSSSWAVAPAGVKKSESGTAGEPLLGVANPVEGATGELWKIDALPACIDWFITDHALRTLLLQLSDPRYPIFRTLDTLSFRPSIPYLSDPRYPIFRTLDTLSFGPSIPYLSYHLDRPWLAAIHGKRHTICS